MGQDRVWCGRILPEEPRRAPRRDRAGDVRAGAPRPRAGRGPAALRETADPIRSLMLVSAIQASVKRSTPLERKTCRKQAFRAPNQGLEGSFSCWIAWQGLA